MSFTPLSFEPSPEALEWRHPFEHEWTAVRDDDGLKDADDGNLFDALDDYLQSQEEPTVPAVPEEPEEDIFDTDLLEPEPFQPKSWCKNKDGVLYQSYEEYLKANKKRGRERLKTQMHFAAECQGQNVGPLDKKPAVKRGRIPKWAEMETHEDVKNFYKQTKRWPKLDDTYGFDIRNEERWEELKQLYWETRQKEQAEQARWKRTKQTDEFKEFQN